VKANGVSYDDETRGQGEPLLLLHGGLGSIDTDGQRGARSRAEQVEGEAGGAHH
jgi:hypothetical protein